MLFIITGILWFLVVVAILYSQLSKSRKVFYGIEAVIFCLPILVINLFVSGLSGIFFAEIYLYPIILLVIIFSIVYERKHIALQISIGDQAKGETKDLEKALTKKIVAIFCTIILIALAWSTTGMPTFSIITLILILLLAFYLFRH